MQNLDCLVKKSISPSDPRHSQHGRFLNLQKINSHKKFLSRLRRSGVLLVVISIFIIYWSVSLNAEGKAQVYEQESAFGQLHAQNQTRQVAQLPVAAEDPKLDALIRYLSDKKSPLVSYAGQISRMPNYKLLLGIAHAESNMCKHTDRNNCWGIGPGSPFYYDDISESLYYANYLIDRYRQLGMKNPETMVSTYVGHYSQNWVAAVKDVMFDLQERGLQ